MMNARMTKAFVSIPGLSALAAALCGALLLSPQFAPAQTWTATSAPTTNWQTIASSADGSRLVAAVYSDGAGGGGEIVSWIIPSTNFALQQKADLSPTKWNSVLVPPVLNVTNLRNEVSLPLTGDFGIYRLVH